jgi:hypothetical protein
MQEANVTNRGPFLTELKKGRFAASLNSYSEVARFQA